MPTSAIIYDAYTSIIKIKKKKNNKKKKKKIFHTRLRNLKIPCNFLEVAVQINGKGTWVWQKPTDTGLFLNFKVICPLNWKSGLISCMLIVQK